MTELITIAELIGKGSFRIPKYQRGYRWTQDEVEKLLNDIYEFNADGTEASEYYCLQPIVVKKNKEGKIKEGEYWRIVDGQQRITTISLILDFISEKLSQNESKITINYEVTDNPLDNQYKDEAKTVIKNWNSKKEKESKGFKLNKLKENLLNSTKVIWYELDEVENEHKVFERLNVGKIPLTSAELIKATLLNSKNFTRDSELSKIQLALQWDEVEHTLQDDAFWCFLSNDTDKTSTRIDRIFELYYGKFDARRNIFEIFKEESKGKYQKEWNKIYDFFRRNVDLFNDPQAQGLTGFVYYYTESPAEIKEIFFDEINNDLRNKKDIIEKLKEYCRKIIKVEDIEKLRYGDDEINNILLLANIGKVAFDGNQFPFERFKINKNGDAYEKIDYDIEHISSQTENDLSDEKERFFYLLSLLIVGSENESNKGELNKLLQKTAQKKIADKDWESLSKSWDTTEDEIKELNFNKIKEKLNDDKYKKYKKYIDDDDIDTDAIGNLVLLDSKTNRSYKNSVFALKKDYIFKSKDFIPPLTICAFMRVRVPDKNSEDVEISSYVSQDVKWNNNDCELNKNNIINSINYLLSDGKSK